MILTGPEIMRQRTRGRITINPFIPERINPNSYNYHLGNELLEYEDGILDPAKEPKIKKRQIGKHGFVLRPGKLYLGYTSEVIGSDYYVPIIKGRSSIGRLGLFIVITADLIDLGAVGCWTLQMHAVQPVKVYPGMQIGQMTFWRTMGKQTLYAGKYQGATGPQETLAYKDMIREA